MAKFKPVILKEQKTKDNKYNIKIRVTHKNKSRYIGTQFYVSDSQIKNGEIIKHEKTKQYNIELRKILNDYETILLSKNIKALSINDIISLLRKTDNKPNSFYPFAEKIISELKGRKSYISSIASTLVLMRKFSTHLTFEDITPLWLQRFSMWYLSQGKRVNSLGIYMRNIRMIYNQAIRRKIVQRDNYPFYDYKIRIERTIKRSLPIEDFQKIRDAKLPKNWTISRDLFILSFCLNGINFKDMLFLKHKDIYEGRVNFNRYKTKRPYSIKIFPEAQEIIDKYKGSKYLLRFIEEKHKRRKSQPYTDITKLTNDHLKLIAADLKINASVSTYFARHSLATIARNIGISRDDIAAILGHGQNSVTDIYIDLDSQRIDDAMRRVLDFIG